MEVLGSVEPVEASRPGQAAHDEAALTVNLRIAAAEKGWRDRNTSLVVGRG
jgi:hypothetical protein